MSTNLAWHFVGKTLIDGQPIPPDGKWLVHKGPVVMCSSGLHASRKITDALKYASGVTICRVQVDDIVEEELDRLVCRKRKILWRVDGEDLLFQFARNRALFVIKDWNPPDVVLDYLKTGKNKSAAWSAAAWSAWSAESAARSAAESAAWSAAESAAESAWSAAESAARSAAWSAWSAAWSAAQSARSAARSARSADENDLVKLVEEKHRG